MRSKSRQPSGQSTGQPQPARPSFREVYAGNVDHVWRTLRRLGVHEAWCDDATQEVFVVVHRRLPEYEPRDRLRGWLGAIAANVAAKYRHREGRMETIDPDKVLDDVPDSGTFDMDGEHASAEEVCRVLQDVDPELRIVFIQHHFDEVPIAEIAKHLEIPVGTAKTRLRLARQSVKAAWTRYKARERHDERRSNVIPILGPLTFLEAGRQTPPLSAETRTHIWSGIEARIGGGGEGGPGGDDGTPPSTQRIPASAGRVLRACFLVGMGVVVGALWDPLHRPRSSSPTLAPAPAQEELVVAPVLTPVAPSAAPSPPAAVASTAPIATSATPAIDIEATLMDRASRALNAGQIDLALAALQEHAARFQGGGRLAMQRETYWIDVLLRAERKPEARARLQAFEARYPNDANLQRFHVALGSP
jgi:RNA polymerase sigma-70 factor (ECF subfamily)